MGAKTQNPVIFLGNRLKTDVTSTISLLKSAAAAFAGPGCYISLDQWFSCCGRDFSPEDFRPSLETSWETGGTTGTLWVEVGDTACGLTAH